ncbi:5360_t:CDS:1 [Paraglomus brasilianum]|uniref:5360_t:CDS:1 n=1 Tax=Paraglomus brasilianum TaxID=144538 RepID=A0A9N8YZA6_9GLOM|nr:5360_t:CDS:1 [Paraglomus brasilianum]
MSTELEQALADVIHKNPHLYAALHTSLSQSSTSDNSSPSSKKAESDSMPSRSSTVDDDISKLIKAHINQTEESIKQNKMVQEEGNKHTGTAISDSFKSPTSNNPELQEKQKQEIDEEIDIESPKPCKNHPASVRCFRCLVGSRGKKVKRVGGNVFGFAN